MVSTGNIHCDAAATRVIIDTDPGIDDAAAILMALGSPELRIEALTTVFDNTLDRAWHDQRLAHPRGGTAYRHSSVPGGRKTL